MLRGWDYQVLGTHSQTRLREQVSVVEYSSGCTEECDRMENLVGNVPQCKLLSYLSLCGSVPIPISDFHIFKTEAIILVCVFWMTWLNLYFKEKNSLCKKYIFMLFQKIHY